MIRRPHVALMIETSSVYGRRLLQGVSRYVRSHRPWCIYLEEGEFDSTPPLWFETWRGDGAISRWSGPHVAEVFRQVEVPMVDVSNRDAPFGLPRITSDKELFQNNFSKTANLAIMPLWQMRQ